MTAGPDTADGVLGVPSGRDRELVIAEFNRAVREPDRSGDPASLGDLLEELAQPARQADEEDSCDWWWISDMLLRSSSSDDAPQQASWDPTMQVMTFYYCVDAHRRGWLRPDRVLTGAQRADLLADLSAWVRADHDADEILARFGPPSLALGDPDPRQPRTLCYVGPDRHEPAVGFHLGVEPRRADGPAVLLATSFDEKPLIWTPRGDTYFTSGPSAGAAGQDAG